MISPSYSFKRELYKMYIYIYIQREREEKGKTAYSTTLSREKH